jgi:phasin
VRRIADPAFEKIFEEEFPLVGAMAATREGTKTRAWARPSRARYGLIQKYRRPSQSSGVAGKNQPAGRSGDRFQTAGGLNRHNGGNMVTHKKQEKQKNRRRTSMAEPKLEVPTELRDLAEKTIDQAEKAFGMFFDAANKSVTSIPGPGTEISKQALSFTQQNMKAAFEHARKLVHATDLQQAMQIQSEFLRSQFTNAGEHMRQITGEVMSAARNAAKPKS